jgi:hypothetical protein
MAVWIANDQELVGGGTMGRVPAVTRNRIGGPIRFPLRRCAHPRAHEVLRLTGLDGAALHGKERSSTWRSLLAHCGCGRGLAAHPRRPTMSFRLAIGL